MFAILITDETVEKIITDSQALCRDVDRRVVEIYNRAKSRYYFIGGYINERGAYSKWTIFPEFAFVENFEYDPDKIKTDWDQIVWK